MKIILFICFILNLNILNAQNKDIYIETEYNNFINQFNISKQCDSIILLVFINKNNWIIKERYITNNNIQQFLNKKYYNIKNHFKLTNIQNNGYVMEITQYNKNNKPIYIYTIFFNFQSNKINVIEIHKNN